MSFSKRGDDKMTLEEFHENVNETLREVTDVLREELEEHGLAKTPDIYMSAISSLCLSIYVSSLKHVSNEPNARLRAAVADFIQLILNETDFLSENKIGDGE